MSLGPLVPSSWAKGGGAGEDKGAARAAGRHRTNRPSRRGLPGVRPPRLHLGSPNIGNKSGEKKSKSRREGEREGEREGARKQKLGGLR